MPKTTKAKEKYWARHLTQLDSSGLSRKAYCQKKKINVHTLDYWKKRLGGVSKPKVKTKPKFKAVTISEKRPAVNENYEIVLSNDRVLKVPSDFDSQKVKHLIEIMDSPL